MSEQSNLNYDDLNLDFFGYDPSQITSLQPSSMPVAVSVPLKYVNRQKSNSQASSKESGWAKRIADTDSLLRQLKDLRQSSNDIMQMYQAEKAKRTTYEGEVKQLREQYEEIHAEVVQSRLNCEQLQAQLDEQKPPVELKELLTGYVRLAQKLTDEDSGNGVLLAKRDLSLLNKIKDYCKSHKIKFPTPQSPRCKRPTRVITVDRAIECCLWSAPPIFENIGKQSTCDQSTQCVGVETRDQGTQHNNTTTANQLMRDQSTQCFGIKTRDQGTQHKNPTTTRSTTTACFIQHRDVGTSFPEPKSMPLCSEILNEMLSWRVDPISPIFDMQPIASPVPSATIETRSVGTCTYLCNVLKNIDYLPRIPLNIKMSNSRPPSRAACDFKDEVSTPPVQQKEESKNSSSDSNVILPEIRGAFRQQSMMPALPNAAFDELWQVFGELVFGLLQRRFNDVATTTVPTTSAKEFNSWLRSIYEGSHERNQAIDASLFSSTPLNCKAVATSINADTQSREENAASMVEAIQRDSQSVGTDPMPPPNTENPTNDGFDLKRIRLPLCAHDKLIPSEMQRKRIQNKPARTNAATKTDSSNLSLIKAPNCDRLETVENLEIGSTLADPKKDDGLCSAKQKILEDIFGTLTDSDEEQTLPRNVNSLGESELNNTSLESIELPGTLQSLQLEEEQQDRSQLNNITNDKSFVIEEIVGSSRQLVDIGMEHIIAPNNSNSADSPILELQTNSSIETCKSYSMEDLSSKTKEGEPEGLNEFKFDINSNSSEPPILDAENNSSMEICESGTTEVVLSKSKATESQAANENAPNIQYETNSPCELIIDEDLLDHNHSFEVTSKSTNNSANPYTTLLKESSAGSSSDISIEVCELDTPKKQPATGTSRKRKIEMRNTQLLPFKRSARLQAKRLLSGSSSLESEYGKYINAQDEEPKPKSSVKNSEKIEVLESNSSHINFGYFGEISAHKDCDRSQTLCEGASEETNSITKYTSVMQFFDAPASPLAVEENHDHPAQPLEIPLERSTNHMQSSSVTSSSLLQHLTTNYKEECKKRASTQKLEKQRNGQVKKMSACIAEYLQNPMVLDTQVECKSLALHLHKYSLDEELIVIAFGENFVNLQPIDLEAITLPRIVNAMHYLNLIYPMFIKEMLLQIENLLFKPKKKPALHVALNLTQIYLRIVFVEATFSATNFDYQNPARLFVAKCLYHFQNAAVRLVYEVLCFYPTVLPNREDRTYDHSDPLITVIKHQLMSIKYDMDDKELCSRELLSKLRFEYHFTPFEPTQNDVLTNLVEKLKAGRLDNLSLAFPLFCKRMHALKVINEVLPEQLLPLANNYYDFALDTTEYDERIVVLLNCISTCIKHLPLETDISTYLTLFARFLNAIPRSAVQEAAVQAVLRLQRFGYAACGVILQHYRPTYKLQPLTMAMLRTYVEHRSRFYKANKASLHQNNDK